MKAGNKKNPKDMLEEILSGNNNFRESGEVSTWDGLQDGQNPSATMVYCSDSRCPEAFLGLDMTNNVFQVKNAGNQIYTAKGTVTYGVRHLNTPLLAVIGHSACGAVTAASGDYSKIEPELKPELDSIKEGIKHAHYDPADSSRIIKLAEVNVDSQIGFACKSYDDLIRANKLVVVGLMFDFKRQYSKTNGGLYIINVNGETNPDLIKNMPLVKGYENQVKRLS